MDTLQQLVVSGRIVDLMIVFVVLELAVVDVYRRLRGSGVPTLSWLVNVGAGVSLMLALRAALSGSSWVWIAAFLVSALVFHVGDLLMRWQAAPLRDDS